MHVADVLVFIGIWYDIYSINFLAAFRKYEIMSWNKKSLKTLKISSFYFTLYFVIVVDRSTMYYLLL
jgi:hypothetical protein